MVESDHKLKLCMSKKGGTRVGEGRLIQLATSLHKYKSSTLSLLKPESNYVVDLLQYKIMVPLHL